MTTYVVDETSSRDVIEKTMALLFDPDECLAWEHINLAIKTANNVIRAFFTDPGDILSVVKGAVGIYDESDDWLTEDHPQFIELIEACDELVMAVDVLVDDLQLPSRISKVKIGDNEGMVLIIV
jgi:hypothetical protein|nr:MAG: hypothetical protein [Bacteriophage sp.]